MKKLAPFLPALAILAFALAARAEDQKRLAPTDTNGYGDTFARIGGSFATIAGSRPAVGTGAAPAARQDYSRTAIDVDFDMMGYWDATRFDTLIGGELLAKVGMHTNEKTNPETNDDPKADATKFFLRTDVAADYALLHWGGSFRGRIGFGAGFGFDYDAPKWYTSGGRVYPLLLARLQLWGGDAFGLHLAYHHVPTTSNDRRVREHRLEGGVGLGALHAGLRLVMTRVLGEDVPGESGAFDSREMGGYVAYAF